MYIYIRANCGYKRLRDLLQSKTIELLVLTMKAVCLAVATQIHGQV